jgi:hypothetical protein
VDTATASYLVFLVSPLVFLHTPYGNLKTSTEVQIRV